MPAYFRCALSEFNTFSDEAILGFLTAGYRDDGFFELKTDAIASWRKELPLFRQIIEKAVQQAPVVSQWHLLVEYPIPRIGKRIDAIFICGRVLVVVEFKLNTGAAGTAKRQVSDYAEDLHDFHKESWYRKILPLVLAPDLAETIAVNFSDQLIHPVVQVNEAGLLSVLVDIAHMEDLGSELIDAGRWDNCLYTPTPTIVEAAQDLYAKHTVDEIMHFSAGKDSLIRTTRAVSEIIENAARQKEKAVCFVTGVPGSGKTLVGLNIANQQTLHTARFMSGNNPLIHVLREALALNLHSSLGESKSDSRRLMGDRIQNIHSFTKELFLDEEGRPPEDGNVIIYDEAQRAWDAAKNRQENDISFSEPEMILEVLGRLDWCVLVAIIGNGQEINTGEAGLLGWKEALDRNRDWKIYIPNTSHAGNTFTTASGLPISTHEDLHLNTSMRSYTAQTLSEWIDLVLAGNSEDARTSSASFSRYPVRLTRSLESAKTWLDEQRKNSSIDRPLRSGLIASSGAKRLRAQGIDVSVKIKETDWFLCGAKDIRSSSFLELAATEYSIQGLELDYVGLCWGADFRRACGCWQYHALSGSSWLDKNDSENLSQEITRKFITNTYRVLLSRAREGMIIWVPEGDASDSTRLPEFYDFTAEYLQQCGVQLVG